MNVSYIRLYKKYTELNFIDRKAYYIQDNRN